MGRLLGDFRPPLSIIFDPKTAGAFLPPVRLRQGTNTAATGTAGGATSQTQPPFWGQTTTLVRLMLLG